MGNVYKEIRSSRNNVKEIEELLTGVNNEFQLHKDEFDKLLIAVTEVVINAIVHGNKLDENKMVRIFIDYDDNEMKIKICDEGNGYDFSKTPDPTLDENIMKTSGRGMFIVKSLFEDVEYKKTEKGTEITIIIKKV